MIDNVLFNKNKIKKDNIAVQIFSKIGPDF